MPLSRELTNKKNDQKERHSRGKAGSGVTNSKKGGAGAHNWGIETAEENAIEAVDKNDPNYDSGEGEATQ